MSFEAHDYVLAHSEVKGAGKFILLTIAKHANKEGEAWPSVQTLGDFARVTDRAVRKCLRELERRGDIVTLRHSGAAGGDMRTNRYRLVMPACSCPRGADGYIRHVAPRRPEDQR